MNSFKIDDLWTLIFPVVITSGVYYFDKDIGIMIMFAWIMLLLLIINRKMPN